MIYLNVAIAVKKRIRQHLFPNPIPTPTTTTLIQRPISRTTGVNHIGMTPLQILLSKDDGGSGNNWIL